VRIDISAVDLRIFGRWPDGRVVASLLELAAVAGILSVFSFLTHFAAMEVDESVMDQALAGGDSEILRLAWNELPTDFKRGRKLVGFAKTAALFHSDEALAMLIALAGREELEQIVEFLVVERCAGAVRRLISDGSDVAVMPCDAALALGSWCRLDFANACGGAWLKLFRTSNAGDRKSLLDRAPPLPPGSIRLALSDPGVRRRLSRIAGEAEPRQTLRWSRSAAWVVGGRASPRWRRLGLRRVKSSANVTTAREIFLALRARARRLSLIVYQRASTCARKTKRAGLLCTSRATARS
jgi:hypothetical protein